MMTKEVALGEIYPEALVLKGHRVTKMKALKQ